MSLYTDKDSILSYRYRCKDFLILFKDGTSKTMREVDVKSIEFTNDFIGATFPLISFKVSMNSTLYYKIIKNKDTVSFKLRIQKYYVHPSSDKKSLYEDYLNTTFNLILDDDDEDLYADIRKTNNKNSTDEDLNEQANEIEFFLFKKSLIKNAKKQVSGNFVNTTLATMVAKICSDMKLDNVLMSSFDNDTQYNEIYIPALKATKALAYLDTYYGFNKDGTMIYFDVNRSYIIKFDGSCTAYEDKEIKTTTVIVPKAGSALAQDLGVLYKKDTPKMNYIIADYKTFDPKNMVKSSDIINTEDIDVMDTDDGSVEYGSNTAVNKNVLENKGVNKYLKKIYDKQHKSLETVITCEFSDIDLDMITPNKKFIFVFEDTELSKKYKGTYILCSLDIGLFRNGSDLTTESRAVFRRDT